MKRLIVYGPVTGFSSYPVVMKGLIRGLVANGVLPQVIDTTGPAANHANGELDGLGIEWLDGLRWDIANAGSTPESLEGTGVVLVLNPHPEVVLRLAEAGIAAVGLHVGDVDAIPPDWAEAIRGEWLTVVPSPWLARVVEHAVAREVMVVPHGVDEAFCRTHEPRAPGTCRRVLHPCSAIYFPERKGTPQVLQAVDQCANFDFILTLLVPRGSRAIDRILVGMPEQARSMVRLVEQPEGLPATAVRELYLEHDLLLCPSRAEGFGLCVGKGAAVTTRGGVTPIEKIAKGEEVLTAAGEWSKVVAVASRKTKSVLRITCQGLPEIVLTPEHLVLATSRGSKEKLSEFRSCPAALQWLRADQLDETCYVVMGAPAECAGGITPMLNLAQFVRAPVIEDGFFWSRYSNKQTSGVTVSGAAQQIGVSEAVLRRALQPCAVAKTEKTQEKRSRLRSAAIVLGLADQKVKLPLSVAWSVPLCRLVGYYAAEGFCNGARATTAGFALNGDGSDARIIEHIEEAAAILGLKASTYARKGTKGVSVVISSVVLGRALRALCNTGARNKRLPEVVWSLSSECRAAMLEALVRGDGCNRSRCLSFDSTSMVLAFQVRDLWLSLGIPASIKPHRQPKCVRGRLRPVRRHGVIQKAKRPAWRVRVYGAWYVRACRLLNLVPKNDTKTLRRGSGFVCIGNQWLTRVRSVRKSTTTLPVYDLQVDAGESFVANGMIVHNCPLEARACGVPVVQTGCTGMEMHFAKSGSYPGVRRVPHGPLAPAWAGFGQAPSVHPDRVAGVLRAALRDLEQLKREAWEAAPQVAEEWAWPCIVTPLAARLKERLS